MRKPMSLLFILLLLIIAVSGIIMYFYIPKSTLAFKDSNKELLNPGRGFYVQIYSHEEERFEELKNENAKIALCAYNIKKYLNIKITEEKLNELEKFLNEARKNDMQIVFRAAYGFNPKYTDPDSIENIITHIKQIAPVLNANKDVILSVQAGFIGPWGEWHSSKFFTGDEEEVKLRNEILSVLLDNLNHDIVVNVRRPRFIRDAADAGIDIARIGLHNDALLSTNNDMGTYDDLDYTREDELEWAKVNILHGVNGGEMPLVSEYSSINNAVKEMESLHITYLNSRYNKEVLEQWKTVEYKGQNGFEYIKNHLGYRLWLGEVELSSYIKPHRDFSLRAVIHNSGFAPIDNGNELFLVIKKGEEIIYESILEGKLSTISNGEGKEFLIKTHIDDLFEADNNEDILLGIYIANSDNNGYIELANTDLIYKDNVYYFAKYKFDNKKYVLDKN
ncbi:DUF4832 domain-containing protein [Oceanirhabdus sp. W0125-5]|uniref:DUF4832 domain-containing protein n=1 Tax=Oceanirhabdus sp. W0125-5 TaxID=2999116 RepID=UPI0022F2B81F|nr:DUF4832 domain-containing protein [Oceanirhabdus sp. W0125-5]WBW98617.1 DUF4832 domain-containing protein [Oceanirhabdus sp. W0125-5]